MGLYKAAWAMLSWAQTHLMTLLIYITLIHIAAHENLGKESPYTYTKHVQTQVRTHTHIPIHKYLINVRLDTNIQWFAAGGLLFQYKYGPKLLWSPIAFFAKAARRVLPCRALQRNFTGSGTQRYTSTEVQSIECIEFRYIE